MAAANSLSQLYNIEYLNANLPEYFHHEFDEKLMKLVRDHLACLWVAGDLDLKKDNLSACPEDIRQAVKIALAFLMRADDIVVKKLGDVSKFDVLPDRQYFTAVQTLIELVHREVYTKMVTTQLTSTEINELDVWGSQNLHVLFNWLDDVNDQHPWVQVSKWASLEGIIFNFAFALFCWIRFKNLLPEFTKANEYIMRDEQFHAAAWLRVLGLLKENNSDCKGKRNDGINPLSIFLRAHQAQDFVIERFIPPSKMRNEIRQGSDYLTKVFLDNVREFVAPQRVLSWVVELEFKDAQLYEYLIGVSLPEYLEASRRITKSQFLDNTAGGYEYQKWNVKQQINF